MKLPGLNSEMCHHAPAENPPQDHAECGLVVHHPSACQGLVRKDKLKSVQPRGFWRNALRLLQRLPAQEFQKSLPSFVEVQVSRALVTKLDLVFVEPDVVAVAEEEAEGMWGTN